MNEPRVRLVTTTYCGYCKAAKRLLDDERIAYRDIDVTADRERRDAVISETGWKTVPVVFLDGELVGGYQELKKLHRAGGLADL